MTADPSDRFAFAQTLIREAGAIALSYFQRRSSLTIRSKGLQDMVSEADLNTELHIKGRLAEAFPDDAFLGEETGITDVGPDQGLWVVDPIDGTQPFVSGMASWCVSIAYLRGSDLRFGMVYAPVRDELFAGGVDHPATVNGAPVEVHPGTSLKDGIVGVGYSPRVRPEGLLPKLDRFLREGGMFYRDGSGALMLSYVAAGRLLGYVEPHINSWDCLGAIAVIRAAGLRTNDFLANDGLRKGNRIIAGNAHVYPELDAIWGAGA
jgi:myo-inositol-1(or 4)-monophosphatase